jgi:hypothetical protein
MAAFHPLETFAECLSSTQIGHSALLSGNIGAWVGVAGTREGFVKLYRINKLTRPGGAVVKKKDVLAASDREAVQRAADSEDCPICDVLRDGQTVGSII